MQGLLQIFPELRVDAGTQVGQFLCTVLEL
jgi:hypothetical protein